jgi:hypothetical protein
MTPKIWCARLPTNSALYTSNKHKIRFCRILRSELKHAPLYIIADVTEPITSHSIRALSGDKDFSVGAFEPEMTYVTLDHLLLPKPQHTNKPHIIISNHLVSAALTPTTRIVFQINSTRTTTTGKTFFEIMQTVYAVHQGPLGTVSRFDRSRLGRELEWDDWREAMEEMALKQENLVATMAEGLKFLRRSFRESQSEEQAKVSRLSVSVDEMKHRFATSHELQVQTCLDSTRGNNWGKYLKITGLNDVFAFVYKGLGCSDAETMTARKRLYRSLMSEYTGGDYKEKKTPLTEVDFQTVFAHLGLPNLLSWPLLINCNFGWMSPTRRQNSKIAPTSTMEEEKSRRGLPTSRI